MNDIWGDVMSVVKQCADASMLAHKSAYLDVEDPPDHCPWRQDPVLEVEVPARHQAKHADNPKGDVR